MKDFKKSNKKLFKNIKKKSNSTFKQFKEKVIFNN